jgi:NADPH:quinone reductase-like Zn-dependent oxidoreductase
MKAVVLHNYGGIEQLRLEEIGMPPIGAKEVRIRLHATSINPIDWKMRSGSAKDRFPLRLPAILGVDAAGEVDAAPPDVDGFPKGMRVMAKTVGTYAQYAVVKADELSPIPDDLSYEQAAALPTVGLTGAQLIERGGKPEPGQTVLVTGALGSVGRVAVYVARQKSARVLAGVRASQRENATKLGAAAVVALDDEEEMGRIHDLDVVADTVGGAVQSRVIKLLKDGGTYTSVIGPPKENPGRSIRVTAIVAQPDASRLYELAKDVARGSLIIPIAATYPLEKIQEATQRAEQGAGGKIVLTLL